APVLPVIPELLAVSASRAGEVTDATVYVGQAEMDAFRLQQEIQHELETHWRPPVGLPEVTCQIKALVNAQGAAQTVTMVKASGVLVYDVSARSAVQSIHFPAAVNGKELIITLSWTLLE